MNNYCAEPQAHPDRCGCKPDAFQIARHSRRLVEQQGERHGIRVEYVPHGVEGGYHWQYSITGQDQGIKRH